MNQSKIKFVLLFIIGATWGAILFFSSTRQPLTAQVLTDTYLPLISHRTTNLGPYIAVIPECWTPGSPSSTVQLVGGNWPTTPAAQSPITIYLRDNFGNSTNITTIPQGHGGSFSNVMVNVASFTPVNSPYFFVAQAPNGAYDETMFVVPCEIIPPTPTPTPTVLATISTADAHHWNSALDYAEYHLGEEKGAALVMRAMQLVRALLNQRRRPFNFLTSGCSHICEDELTLMSALRIAQSGVGPHFQDAIGRVAQSDENARLRMQIIQLSDFLYGDGRPPETPAPAVFPVTNSATLH